ncbi:YibE/F family protein [Sutcliffiella sp. NPDC057660]|uniref:YibE/F family protein n=1 Tax=Sutcliffiella sp. NPDC057660 TaxID=3346199 RepID=UPI0036C2DFE4
MNKFKKVVSNHIFLYAFLGVCFISSVIFVNHNHSFYDDPIVEVIETSLKDKEEVVDSFNNKDLLTTQGIIAKVKNGDHKGEIIHLTNKYSLSGAYDQENHVGNELFVSIDANKAKSSQLTGTIAGVKRDTHVLIVAWIFVFVLLIVGKRQGFFSIVSLAVNAILISVVLDIFMHSSNVSLLFICGISVILFTVISLLLVNGFNEKTFAAIVSTLLGTFFSLLITFLVMWLTKEKGLRYEEMQFLTSPPQMVFMAGLLIGSLGAVMDVAITMSSSIFGLYEEKRDISVKALQASGMEIGKDIMGTMTNILFFAYISGSIPMLILYLMNDFPFGITLSINLSLEMARALAGGIGIVLTIPIGLYISIFFVNRKRARL